MPLKFQLRKKRDKGEKSGAEEGKVAASSSNSSEAVKSVGKQLLSCTSNNLNIVLFFRFRR